MTHLLGHYVRPPSRTRAPEAEAPRRTAESHADLRDLFTVSLDDIEWGALADDYYEPATGRWRRAIRAEVLAEADDAVHLLDHMLTDRDYSLRRVRILCVGFHTLLAYHQIRARQHSLLWPSDLLGLRDELERIMLDIRRQFSSSS